VAQPWDDWSWEDTKNKKTIVQLENGNK